MKDAQDTRTADWIGAPQPETRASARDTRPSVADAKAVALLQLGELITKIPPHIAGGGSIEEVRAWKASCTTGVPRTKRT